MPVFKYRGYNRAGSEITGIIEADGQRDAALKIKASGVLPKEISESDTPSKRSFIKRRSPIDLSSVTRSLSTSLSAGVPLIDALTAIASEQKGEWRGILTDIKEQVSGGASLAKAMHAYKNIFPEFYTGMVSAGESSGRLPDVLIKIADFLETDSKIKSKVQTALIYPIFMASVSIVIMSFLFIFVVPKITLMFENNDAALPMITVILIGISNLFQNFWWLLLIFLAGSVYLFRKAKASKEELFDSFLLKDPIGVLMSLYMMRFSMTMSFLLDGGLPILKAMKLTSTAIGNAVLKKQILAAEDSVSQGASLSGSLEKFPPTIRQIISTGENTGKLPEVLRTISNSYEAEFDRKLQRMIGLLEPCLILFMGIIVGFIVIAVLLPIFELNQLIK